MRYVAERTVWILVLFGAVALLLACASGILGWQAYTETRKARAAVERADSLVVDWIKRGCAPRSRALP